MPMLLYLPVSLAAAWLDLRHRRIPNWLCLATAVSGLLLAVFISGATAAGTHALHVLISLLAGLVLFRIGAIGGGDAKFYSATTAWFPLTKAISLFVSVALCGVVLLIGWSIYRRARGYPLKGNGTPFDGLPYGVAISAGALVAMLA